MGVAQELGMIDHNPNDDDVASRPQSLAEWVAAQADALPPLTCTACAAGCGRPIPRWSTGSWCR